MLRLLKWLGELTRVGPAGCCISYTSQLESRAYKKEQSMLVTKASVCMISSGLESELQVSL